MGRARISLSKRLSARHFAIGRLAAAAFFAVVWWCFAASGVAAPANALSANTLSTDPFLAGLRQRSLFGLAERHGLDRLQRADLSELQRATLVIELSRTLAMRAVASPPAARRSLWLRATTVGDDFARQYPNAPQLPLVRLQGAITLLTQGELARQEAQLTGAQQTATRQERNETAKTQLRAAIAILRQLDDDVAGALREQNRTHNQQTGTALTAAQLASLHDNLQYELARALRNQAACYPPGSPDRVSSLTQAVALLQPLSTLDPAHPLAAKSRIDLIIAYRLLGDHAMAQRQLAALFDSNLSAATLLKVRAERLRLALATGRLPADIATFLQQRQEHPAHSARLDDAWLEVFLAAGRDATKTNDTAKATQWQQTAAALVRQIEQRYGPYWTRRAGMLLSQHVRTDGSSSIATLLRAAEGSYRSGQQDDAIAIYDRAAALATQQGNADETFRLCYIAATIEHQRERHAEAMARYRQLATTMPTHTKAPEAHLLAIHHAARLTMRENTNQETVASTARYVALLQEHVRIWPHDPSTDKVYRWLGQYHAHQGAWEEAIVVYRAIAPGTLDYHTVVEAIDSLYRKWFMQRRVAGESSDRLAADAATAATWFRSLVDADDRRVPAHWDHVQRAAALAAARLDLLHPPDGYAKAEQTLRNALQQANADAPWRSTVETLLVCALAGQGRHREASQRLAALSTESPDDLLAMLQGLADVTASSTTTARGELATLRLSTIDMLQAATTRLSESQREVLDTMRAEALGDAGHTNEARAAHRRLADANPRNATIQEAYAKLLATASDAETLRLALVQWRKLEKNSRPQSSRWFQAKLAIADLHFRLGNSKQAAKLIQLLRLLHPELGGAEMKAKFEALLKRVEKELPQT